MSAPYSQINRPKKTFKHYSKESMTERAGYIPAKQKIESFIDAGERLISYRQEQFDFNSEEDLDEDFIDPTRHPSFDRADATELAKDLNHKHQESLSKAVTEPLEKPEEVTNVPDASNKKKKKEILSEPMDID